MSEQKNNLMIPYGVSDFKRIRSEGYYYVDKTEYLAKLESRDSFVFFVRPRRFGKSLFISMMQCYYDPRSGQEVFDEDFSIAVTGKISGGKGTFGKKFDSSDFGGWWAAPNVKGELYAGIKIEGFGLFSASGNVGTDRCDNHELSGGVCMQGQVGLALSGGAVFDMYWNSAHFKAGAEVTGMITASLSRCIVCNSDGCNSMPFGQVAPLART